MIKEWTSPRSFARSMLSEDRLVLRPIFDSVTKFADLAIESVLFRDGCWQVELICMLPNVEVSRHRHNRVSSVDLLLAGDGGGDVLGRSIGKPRRGSSLAANLISVPKGAWHGGHAGEQGVMYLSFQQWDGVAGHISEDWEAWLPAQT